MEQGRALRLRQVLFEKTCCRGHLYVLLKESVGMPFSALTDVNFLYCRYCRPQDQQNNTGSPSSESISSSSSPALPPAPSLSGPSSPSLLDVYFHEFSAAVASKASKRSRESLGCTVRIKECKDVDDDVKEEEDALTKAPAETSTIESIPHHLLFGNAVLSRLPLCDIVRACFVSRAWMTNIDAALQNPAIRTQLCLHRPFLMLLNPASKRIGACACLSVFDVSINTWLPTPILFPSNASFLVGVSCGLFCFATGNPLIDSTVDYFVGNPLMHTWTCLPRPPPISECSCCHSTVRVAFVASQSSPKGLGYKLLRLVSTEEGWLVFRTYDSRKREWEIVGKDGCITLARSPVEHIVLEDSGLVHFFNSSLCHFWTYDLHTGKMQDTHYVEKGRYCPRSVKESHPLQAAKGRTYLSLGLPSVVKCAERLFNVYRMERRQGYECAVVGLIPLISHYWPVGISRLEDKTRWEFVSEMPSNLLREAVEEGSDGTDFVIGSDHTQHIFFILRGSSKMLAYDVLSSAWKTLPGCPIGQSFYPYKLNAFCEPLLCIEPADTHNNGSGISL